MKKVFRTVLCAAMLAAALCTGVSAAEPQELNIRFNGQPLTFTDAQPQIVSDRTYLPFRAVFTALGFADENIIYTGETRTVSAVREDLTVSMVIGENQVTVVEDGETKVLDTDVPAFIDPAVSRTYVPVGFVAQAVGYRVAWDGESRTVLIDDVEGILASNTETYTILDKYLDYNRKFQQRNYKVEGNFSYSVDVLGEVMGMDGTYSMLTAGNAGFDAEMQMNLTGVVDGADMSTAIPEGIELFMRGDMSTGEFYYKSNSLMSTADPGGENVWFKAQRQSMTQAASAGIGMTYADMVNLSGENVDGRAVIEEQIRAEIQENPAVSAADYLEIYNAMLGDSSFVKDGGDYVNAVRINGVVMSVQFHTGAKADQVNGYTIAMAVEEDGVVMVMETSMKEEHMTACYEIADGFMYTCMEIDGVYTVTRLEPDCVPDEGAVIVELSEEMGNPFGSLIP